MKYVILAISYFMSLPSLADSAKPNVNYHLRKMQTVIDSRASSARIQKIRVDQTNFQSQENAPVNSASFGIGDEYVPNDSLSENTAQVSRPSYTTAEEKVRDELARRRITNIEEKSSPNENADFIREFKENAASRGVQLEVDPVTYEVRKVR